MERDKTLDNLRGLAMLQVILVHVAYYGDLLTNKSFLLFEMPLFFFVMGSLKSNKIKRRLKSLLTEYYKYAAICLLMTLVTVWGMEIKIYLITIISWLIPWSYQVTPIPFITYHLWFMPLYITMIFIMPYMKKNKITGLLFLALFLISCIYGINEIQYISFYALWIFAGMYYKEIKSWNKRNFILIFIFASAALFFLWKADILMDMQENKFPPNAVFGIFSIMTMSIILGNMNNIDKIFEYLKKNCILNIVIETFSKNSLQIFMFHTLILLITIPIATMVPICKTLIGFVLTIALCTIGNYYIQKYTYHSKLKKKN